jgi:hypothetical protein
MKLTSHVFDRKFSFAKASSSATETNVLEPLANEELSKDLSEATIISASAGASDKRKFWEELIAYFPFTVILLSDMTSRKKTLIHMRN